MMSKARETVRKLVEWYGNEVDHHGWQIDEREKVIDEISCEIEWLQERNRELLAACQYAAGSFAQVDSTRTVPPIVLHDCREHLEAAIAKAMGERKIASGKDTPALKYAGMMGHSVCIIGDVHGDRRIIGESDDVRWAKDHAKAYREQNPTVYLRGKDGWVET